MMQVLRGSAIVLTLAAAVSCGQPCSWSPQQPAAAEQTQSGLSAGVLPVLADLPAVGTPARRCCGSDVHQFVAQDVCVAVGAGLTGWTLELEQSGLSYAVLGVEVEPGAVPATLLIGGTCAELYVAVGDYDRGCWRWIADGMSESDLVTIPAGECVSADDVFYVALACPDGAAAAVSVAVELVTPSEEDWNLLVWAAGDYYEAEWVYQSIQQLESVGSTDEVNVLAGYELDPDQLGGEYSGVDQVHFIKVVQDDNDEAIITTGDPANHSEPRAGYNSAAAASLAAFLDWAEANFPADRTALVLLGDGSEWRTRSTSGLLRDENDGFAMENHDEIAAVLAGRQPDVLCFAAVRAGGLEVLYDYRQAADWLVGMDSGGFWDPMTGASFGELLTQWNDSGPLSARAVAELLADQLTEGSLRFTVVDPAALGPLTSSLADFAAEVTAEEAAERIPFTRARYAGFPKYMTDGARDLKTFLDGYSALTGDVTIKALIDAARDDYASAAAYAPGNALAVWLPNPNRFTPTLKNEYQPLPFNQATDWLDMLEAMGVPTEWQPDDRIEISWDSDTDDFDLEITGPDGEWGSPADPDGLSGVIAFGPDSGASGQTREWGQLEWTMGLYVIEVTYKSHVGPPPFTVWVDVQLYDGEGGLKEDLDEVMFAGGDCPSTKLGTFLYYFVALP